MANELMVEVSETAQSLITPLGEVLLAARNAKNLTQKDASDNLRLSLKQIDALETNAFDLLPDAMITRGFIRNYARFLELDSEPLLASYRIRMPEKSPNALGIQSSINQVMLTKKSQTWLIYILGSILVLLCLVSWFFYMDYMAEPTKQATALKTVEAVSVEAPITIPLPEIALPAAERLPETNDAVVGVEDMTTPNNTIDTNIMAVAPIVAKPPLAVDLNTLKANAKPATAQQSAPLATVPQTTTTSSNQFPIKSDTTTKSNDVINTLPLTTAKKVNLSFTEKTWVSVTNKSGKVIFENTFTAGSTDGFDGEPPFNLVIGNAKATKLMYLGKPVDLIPSTKSNVARITLQ